MERITFSCHVKRLGADFDYVVGTSLTITEVADVVTAGIRAARRDGVTDDNMQVAVDAEQQ